MKDHPFASINPGFIIFLAMVAFFLWWASSESNGVVVPCIILAAIITVGGLWGSQHSSNQWYEVAESVGLLYEGGALSGTYRGYRVALPIDAYEGDPFIDTLTLSLNQPVNEQFVVIIESWFGRFRKEYGIQDSQPPDLVERIFSTGDLMERLDSSFNLGRIELKNSTLTLKYGIIPQRKIRHALELARGIAVALETRV